MAKQRIAAEAAALGTTMNPKAVDSTLRDEKPEQVQTPKEGA